MKWNAWPGRKLIDMMIRKYAKKARALWRHLTRPGILRFVRITKEMPPMVRARKPEAPVLTFAGCDSDIFRQMREQSECLFGDFHPNDRVLIKINCNTADPYPASTDRPFLLFVLDLLSSRGITCVTVGDCSALTRLPTHQVFKASGLSSALKGKAKVVCFDEGRWVTVPIPGEYLKRVTVPECVFMTDKIIYLANCKTHRLADFSLGMKLAVGFMHPHERYALHQDHLCEKIAEISLALQPDLTIVDARYTFIDDGPDKGRVAMGNTVFAGRDMLRTDAQAYRLLYMLKKEAGCIGRFSEDPLDMTQFRHAGKLMEEGKWS